MKKEFKTLIFLSSVFVIVYFLFPNIQEDIKKNTTDKVLEKNIVGDLLEKEPLFDEKDIKLTFDIVRISKSGDAVFAGKSEPNILIMLLDNDKEIAKFLSDANGEWIWISDNPLANGIKKFKLTHIDSNGLFYESDQTVVVLNENKFDSKPMVAKLLKSNVETIDMLNLDLIDNGLSLDLVNHTSSGLLILTGRTLPNQEVKFLNLKNLVGKSISDEFGKWKFKILKSQLINKNITILTKIKGEEISLPLSQVALNEFIDSDYKNVEIKKIIVQPGNSLWRIARKNLGGGIFYSEIYKNNIKRIKNPDLIYPGQVFNIPDTKRKTLYE